MNKMFLALKNISWTQCKMTWIYVVVVKMSTMGTQQEALKILSVSLASTSQISTPAQEKIRIDVRLLFLNENNKLSFKTLLSLG